MSSIHHGDKELVELQPFVHQVGGHTCVLEINSRTICKPYQKRELWFYKNEPEELKEFTPKYLGETDVTLYKDKNKQCLVAQISRSILTGAERVIKTAVDTPATETLSSKPSTSHKKRRTSEPCVKDGEHSGDAHLYHKTEDCSSSRADEQDTNIWSVKCIDRQINKYGFWANNEPQKFIILENLVHEYQKPCLMDLKMGRRQYGDDSSADKRKLLETRCAQSTSASYGFRICGTQVFKVDTEKYVFHDKYHGRDLDDSGAIAELLHFFHNGLFLCKSSIIRIISKLERLRSYLLTQSALNFYSCSLLLIYEGVSSTEHENETANPNTMHATTDQATATGDTHTHSTVVNSDLPEGIVERNSNYLTEDGPNAHSNAAYGHFNLNACEDKNDQLNNLHHDCSPNFNVHEDSKTSNCVPRVDVRLIDFAHASEKTEAEKARDVGKSDESILFGLESLLTILKTL